MAKSVGVSERQLRMLHEARGVFEADFGKKVTLGEFIAILVQGYLEGRSIIEKHSEYILTVTEE
jgi:hypothetical protein